MGLLNRLFGYICGRDEPQNGQAVTSTVSTDSSCPMGRCCPAEPPLPAPLPKKKETQRLVQKEFEETSNELCEVHKVAKEKLDYLDDFLSKKIEEKGARDDSR